MPRRRSEGSVGNRGICRICSIDRADRFRVYRGLTRLRGHHRAPPATRTRVFRRAPRLQHSDRNEPHLRASRPATERGTMGVAVALDRVEAAARARRPYAVVGDVRTRKHRVCRLQRLGRRGTRCSNGKHPAKCIFLTASGVRGLSVVVQAEVRRSFAGGVRNRADVSRQSPARSAGMALRRPWQTRDRTELLAWFRDRLAETLPFGAGDDTTKRLFDAGRKALTFHHDVVYRNERTKTIAVEKMVQMKLGGGVTFVGRVDRIAFDPSGTVEVIDYKASQTTVYITPENTRHASDCGVRCCHLAGVQSAIRYRPPNSASDRRRREICPDGGRCPASDSVAASVGCTTDGKRSVPAASWNALRVVPIQSDMRRWGSVSGGKESICSVIEVALTGTSRPWSATWLVRAVLASSMPVNSCGGWR